MIFNIQQLLQKVLSSIFLNPWTLPPLILFLFFLYKWLHQTTTLISRKKLPPSPPKLPIIGNIYQLSSLPHRSLHSLSQRYGDIMMLQLGSVPTLVVSSARAAREIMVTHDVIFANRPIFKKVEKLLYNYKDIVSAPYGEYWRQMKSICVLNLLSNKRVKSFKSVREEETAILVQKIRDSESKFPVNLTDLLIQLTNSTICRVAFGRKYDGEENGIDFKKLLEDLSSLSAEFNVGDLIPWLAWIDRLNGLNERVDKMAEKFDQFIEKVIGEHEDRSDDRRKDGDGENDEKMKDIVDVLLDVKKDQTLRIPIDRDSIKAIILDMFAAGTDTTSTLLEWTMTELLRHPKAMKELQKEVREITRDKSNIEEDDLGQMKYMNAVIKESLRLHLPVPMLVFRQSTQEVNILGYDIPARTMVIINGFAIHRDPTTWDEPEKFKPERFLNSEIDFRGQDFEFIPFGAGRRMCPGISFAITISKLVLANLIQKFDWKLPRGVEGECLDIYESIGINVRRKTPLFVVATPYNPATGN